MLGFTQNERTGDENYSELQTGKHKQTLQNDNHLRHQEGFPNDCWCDGSATDLLSQLGSISENKT